MSVSPLFTDLYQLTMAYGYWKAGLREHEATFHAFFRRPPFNGGYSVTAGLEAVCQFLSDWQFSDEELDYLASLIDRAGTPLFPAPFLKYLKALRFTCAVDAMPEGTPVFPYEPMLRVQGPIIQAQLVESPVLNLINFPTLIATKAARICQAAQGDPVIEFGMRRAQGVDGALTAARSAYIGGCESTSDTQAGMLYGIPVRGTHSHSWVLAFDTEQDSFEAFVDAYPDNAILLVDTFDSLEGVRKTIAVAQKLRKRGHEIFGIRLDSGDLAYLSVHARAMLDEAGFPEAHIVASNELDENLITDLKRQGAKVDMWGVGTHLVTAKGDSSLSGVYKLSAVRAPGGAWQPKLKLSEQLVKVTDPGVLQVRRFEKEGLFIGDLLFDTDLPPQEPYRAIDPFDHLRSKRFDAPFTDLLVPIFRAGRQVYTSPPLPTIQQHAQQQLAKLHPTHKRLLNPHPYVVGMDQQLHQLKMDLIQQARKEEMVWQKP